jgi:hypothetical protein
MTPAQSAHLNEESINDVLIGLGTPESEAHLAACSECRSHVQGFRADVKAFNQTTLAWSEARPVKTLRAGAAAKVWRAMVSPPGWAFAAALLVVLGYAVGNHFHSPSSSGDASVTAPTDTDTQIAQDNELLRSVNVALNETEESPISEYHLVEAPHSRLKARPELRKR